MEAMVTTSTENGQKQKSPMEVVSKVLGGSSLFLQNVGLQDNSKKSSTTTISAKVQELQNQLESERLEKDGLQEEVETLKAQAQASKETMDNMKKSMEENNSLLCQLLSSNGSKHPHLKFVIVSCYISSGFRFYKFGICLNFHT
jgi:predicted nuclease with TOPRIM domain